MSRDKRMAIAVLGGIGALGFAMVLEVLLITGEIRGPVALGVLSSFVYLAVTRLGCRS